jgi:hypothetical protein
MGTHCNQILRRDFPTMGNGVRLMTAKAGWIRLSAMVLVTLAMAGFGRGAARAQDACLAAPNAPAPPGSHWYYRTDKPTQRKCWYVRPIDQPPNQGAQATPGQQQLPATAVSTGTPAATAAKPTQDLPAHRAQDSSAVSGGARAGGPSSPNAAFWTDPAPSAATNTFAWPDPPAPPVNNATPIQVQSPATDTDAQGASTSTPAMVNPQAVPESSTTATPVDNTGANGQAADKPATAPDKLAARQTETPVGIILAVIAGLLIAGALMRQLLKMAFAHRAIRIERHEPVLIESIATETPSPDMVPGHVEPDPRFDEIEELLRKLARRLRRPRPTPFKIVPPFSSSESARVHP